MKQRGYALMIVLLVLALMSVGLGTLFYFLEASAATTGSMLERRRVFYACDGIGRATTVLAQSYMVEGAPTTPGLIKSVCTAGGGGCCPSATGLVGDCDAAVPPASTSTKTAFVASPSSGPTAMPRLVPSGFKLKEFRIESLAAACVTDVECPSGATCFSGTCRVLSPLPNGPFEGMNARQDTIEIALRAEHTATTQFACKTSQTLTLGKIAMFQFFVFSDSPITDWHPGPEMFATGRVHGNGTVCVGGGDDLWADRITASGDVRHMNEPECFGSGRDPVKVAIKDNPDFDSNDNGNPNDPVAGDFVDFTDLSRSSATPNWATFAVNTWKGHLLDRAHGVPRLKLPIVGTPQTQQGVDGANATSAATRNGTTSRLLIDPVRTGVDTPEIRAQKFATKADIRIVNGIWFLKNVADENQWPGIPIWSDHIGNYAAHNQFGPGIRDLEVGNNPVTDRKVGQSELNTDRGWSGAVPKRFSYYAVNAALDELLIESVGKAAMPPAVISYGVLARSGVNHTSTWAPGARSLFQDDTNDHYSLCGAQPLAPTGAKPWRSTILPALNMPCAPGPFAAVKFKTGAGAALPEAATVDHIAASALIAGTRSGFRDGHAEVSFDDDNKQSTSIANYKRANVLPVNFDLAAFQLALQDTTVGELGSWFCPKAGPCGCSGKRGCMGRPFNGIVWIGSTYSGSEIGYPDFAPTDLPGQGRINDATQPIPDVTVAGATGADWFNRGPAYRLLTGRAGRASASGCDVGGDDDNCVGDEQSALPYPLCGTGAGSGFFDSNRLFRHMSCTAATTSRPNAIRVINARNINMEIVSNAPDINAPVGFDPTRVPLPDGLSLISNLPVYVVGDVNLASDPEGGFPLVVAPNDLTTTTWWPVLIGGDVVHLLSNAWDDRRSRWSVSTGSNRYLGHMDANGAEVNPEQGSDAEPRDAVESFYYLEILGGWGSTVDASNISGGVHNFPRFLEDWGGVRARIRGSLVIGHSKVYSRFKFHCCDDRSYDAPIRDWGFDPALGDLRKQPPGAPVYDVAAIQQWSRN
ncbi:MAG: hypothetical protein Q8O67_14600 [Deltaproteobacteria bacterium]|nr:hypothetical protein [Deltaproteobacteria bacterium]